MSPGEEVDLALARVASAAEDACAVFESSWGDAARGPVFRELSEALAALEAARKAYRDSYRQAS